MGVKLFNGSAEPLVPNGQWGEGVVMPGEFIEVDNPDAYPCPPWTRDQEAEEKLAALVSQGDKQPVRRAATKE